MKRKDQKIEDGFDLSVFDIGKKAIQNRMPGFKTIVLARTFFFYDSETL